ncbi:hypothetical protein ACFL14_01485 [Patescibacteria group bacterium]
MKNIEYPDSPHFFSNESRKYPGKSLEIVALYDFGFVLYLYHRRLNEGSTYGELFNRLQLLCEHLGRDRIRSCPTVACTYCNNNNVTHFGVAIRNKQNAYANWINPEFLCCSDKGCQLKLFRDIRKRSRAAISTKIFLLDFTLISRHRTILVADKTCSVLRVAFQIPRQISPEEALKFWSAFPQKAHQISDPAFKQPGSGQTTLGFPTAQ